jgi:hypothetical protein
MAHGGQDQVGKRSAQNGGHLARIPWLIWEQAAQAVGVSPPVFTLVICALGGLLVGVLVKVFGDYSGIFAELMLEFGKTSRFNYRHTPGIVIAVLVSLDYYDKASFKFNGTIIRGALQ